MRQFHEKRSGNDRQIRYYIRVKFSTSMIISILFALIVEQFHRNIVVSVQKIFLPSAIFFVRQRTKYYIVFYLNLKARCIDANAN